MLLSAHGRLYNLSSWAFMESDGEHHLKIQIPGVSVSVHIPSARFPSAECMAEVIRMNSDSTTSFTMAELGERYALWAEARKCDQ